MLYDASAGRTILFSGSGGQPTNNETWWYELETTAPSPPTDLSASAGFGRVDLSWHAPVSDGGSPLASYRIYRGTAPDALSQLVDSGLSTTYADTNVTNGITYYYRVSALSAAGESLPSNEADATPLVGPPNPPRDVSAFLVGANSGDVRINWTVPVGTIDEYQVFFGTNYDPAKAGYALLADNIPPNASSWTHVGGGNGDPNSYFYFVRAVNAGGSADSATQAVKFTRQLTQAGWNLVSIPATLQDTGLASALQTLSWRTARTYVASDSADPWKAWFNAKGNGDLRTVNTGMALWVDIIAPNNFTVAGQVPANTTIVLSSGWNFVGYASFISRLASLAFPAGLGVNQMEVYVPAAPYYLENVPLATVDMEAGEGYWAYAANGGAWIVTN